MARIVTRGSHADPEFASGNADAMISLMSHK